MNTPAKVLLIGNERPVLEARARVLHHFWEIEMTTLEESDLPVFSADVSVLCNTLPDPERHDWILHVRDEVPNMLVVKMNGHDSGPRAGADATVNVHKGPGALVSAIYELLTERGLPSRKWADPLHLVPLEGVQ